MPSLRSVAAALGMLGAAAGAAFAYSLYVEPKRFRLRTREILLERFPTSLDGLRLLHISDLHLHQGEREKIAMLRRLASVKADLVVFTGDFTDFDRDIDLCVESIAGIRGRLGTFAVLGNHDLCVYQGSRMFVWEDDTHNFAVRRALPYVVRRLRDTGIDLLRNDWREMRLGSQPFWVVGVDDPHQGWDDLARATEGVPQGEPIILLSHSPEIMARLGSFSPDLILSGHTHGGQVVFPLVGALVTRTTIPLPKACGTFDHKHSVMHISPGLGGSISMRFNRPPEAEVLVLRSAQTPRDTSQLGAACTEGAEPRQVDS